MLDGAARRIVDPPLERLGRHAARAGLSADAITIGGFAVGLAAMAAVALEAYLFGLVLLLLNRLADGLDGAVARRAGATDLGGFLDIVLDFILYAGMVFAFALAAPERNALAAAFLIFSFMGTGASFLAFAVMAAKRGLATSARGRKSIYYLGGLAEGTETILFFVVACLLPGAFVWLAAVFGAMCWLTTLGRIAAAWQQLR
jgi:phosphatidylglycerophosphate synthase